MTPDKKYRAWVFGLSAESRAVWLLRLKGYRILARRHKTLVGEIDVVARRGGVLCFVEVKGRTAAIEETPVSGRQMQRIARAAQSFVQSAPDLQSLDMRFDIILVRPRHWPLHETDVWRPT